MSTRVKRIALIALGGVAMAGAAASWWAPSCPSWLAVVATCTFGLAGLVLALAAGFAQPSQVSDLWRRVGRDASKEINPFHDENDSGDGR